MRDAGGSEGLSAGEIFRVRAEGNWDEQLCCGAELPELCFSWPQGVYGTSKLSTETALFWLARLQAMPRDSCKEQVGQLRRPEWAL